MKRIAVIGAGVAGLAAAGRLVEAGRKVVIFEKSRSLGGRCAARAWEGCVFDHGAQFFTVRDEAFRGVIGALGDAVREINAPVVDADEVIVSPDARRYYHVEGNNRLGRSLAQGLEVRREARIDRVIRTADGWRVANEQFDTVISCAPWPQTAALLGSSGIPNPYERNLTAAFLCVGDWAGRARDFYAVSDRTGARLAWSACENHKACRVPAGRTLFVAQASAEFSEAHWDADPASWAAALRTDLATRWELSTSAFEADFTHRWGFSRRVNPAAVGRLPTGFLLCGDSVADSRIESVWLSGRRAAEAALV